jgi:hypothetical protein
MREVSKPGMARGALTAIVRASDLAAFASDNSGLSENVVIDCGFTGCSDVHATSKARHDVRRRRPAIRA